MAKTLKDIREKALRLREGAGAYVATVQAKKRTYRSDTSVDDDESGSLEPKAAGEKAFKAMHTSTTTDFGDQDNNKNQADTKTRINHRAGDEPKIGERQKVTQGTSTVKGPELGSYTKQTPTNYADKRGGETTPVRTSPSAVAPFADKTPRVSIKQFRESMQFGILRIVESRIGGRVIFEDGHVDVADTIAEKLAEVYSLLEDENAKKFIEIGSSSAEGLRELIDFAFSIDAQESEDGH
jgi:hypothetical protein